jgi:integrase
MKTTPIKLTVEGLKKATCPPDKDEIRYPIEGLRGTYLRVRGNRKTVLVQYRDASGKQRWYQVCDAATVVPKDIAEAIEIVRGRLAKGGDPAGERKAEVKRARARLEPALEAYEADLERRHVVQRKLVMSLLRREMLRPLGNVDLATLTRNDLVERIAAVEASGRPGAAQDLRKNAAVFLGWCADTGRITTSPLAGWRRQRKTRAQRLDRAGRALQDWEIPILWEATKAASTGVQRGDQEIGFYHRRPADRIDGPFEAYLKCLLLLGQRRTETALMRWADVDLRRGVWIVPAEVTKSGREHRVPLPPQVRAILEGIPRRVRSPYVFWGRHGKAIAGWSKRLLPVYEASDAAGMVPWTIHDLRRTMRTGLGRLGVDRVLAELLLNHAISDELSAIYDREEYWTQRVEAASRWADHVMKLVMVRQPVAHHAR